MESGSKTIQVDIKSATHISKEAVLQRTSPPLIFESKTAAAFEGFFDFFSYLAIHQNESQTQTNFVILNSVSFFEKARPFMEEHDVIRLYLDRDQAGQNCSQHALSISKKFTDESHFYKDYKDLNEWLVNRGKLQSRKQSHGLR